MKIARNTYRILKYIFYALWTKFEINIKYNNFKFGVTSLATVL